MSVFNVAEIRYWYNETKESPRIGILKKLALTVKNEDQLITLKICF